MNHLPRHVCSVLFLFATLPALPAQRGERDTQKLQHFTLQTGTVTSEKVRDGEAGYSIYLPKGYADEANKDRQYPWILWLPGFGGPDEFGERGGAMVLDRLRGEQKVPDLALVVFRAPGRRGRTVYMNGEAQSDTEDLIVGDLIDTLQKRYRLANDRKQRGVMGVSAGGFGAMKIAMRHPEVFGVVAVHSAAILPGDPDELSGNNESIVQRQLRGGIAKELGDPIDKDKWAAHMPLGIIAKKKPEDLKGLQIYFDVGSDDNYGFCEPNELLSKRMTEAGFKHMFRKVEDGGHAWGSPTMHDSVATSLQFVGLALLGKDAAAAMSAEKPAEKPDGAKKEAGEKKDR